MSKELQDELCLSMCNAYSNIWKKHGLDPMPYHVFRVRVDIWKEW